MRSQPLVTIAIATFNRCQLLRETVESALVQTYPHLEIWVRDDGEDQLTERMMRDFARADSRVRYEKNVKHSGIAETWTSLIGEAKGEYVMILGDDDRLLPSCVSALMKALDPESALAFSNHYLIDRRGNRLEKLSLAFTRKYGRAQLQTGRQVEAEKLAWQNSVPFHSTLFRTDYVRKIGFRKDLNMPDFEFLLRLSLIYNRFVFVPDYLTEIRIHPFGNTAAGLENDRLVQYLIHLPVSPAVEPVKRQLIQERMVNAVSRLVLAGRTGEARSLYRSVFYPGRQKCSPAGIAQLLALHLPAFLGVEFYRFAYRMKRAGRLF